MRTRATTIILNNVTTVAEKLSFTTSLIDYLCSFVDILLIIHFSFFDNILKFNILIYKHKYLTQCLNLHFISRNKTIPLMGMSLFGFFMIFVNFGFLYILRIIPALQGFIYE